EPPDRRRRPDPALGRDREDVEAPGEEHDAGEHQPARGPEQRGIGKLDRDDAHREQAEGVEDVVLDSGMPHGEHLGRNPALERVGAKGAERDREERGDAAEREKEPDRGRQGCHDKILAAMAKIVSRGIDRLKTWAGKEVAVTEWLAVTQEHIDEFADATFDDQWIHVDRERAARESPYKTTVAHGFLTLSLLPHFFKEAVEIEGARMGINYGLNRV